MKIQYCSDLHFEFKMNFDWCMKNPLTPVGDVLLIAGDFDYLGEGFGEIAFFDWCSENYKETILIPGNHEYYGGFPIDEFPECYRKSIRENVFLTNNYTIDFEECRVLCTTLWSEVKKHPQQVKNGVNDFRKIYKSNGEKITIADFNNLHYKSLNYLDTELSKDAKKPTVILTHHLPSRRCNNPIYLDSPINEAFSTNLDWLIEKYQPEYWIYGHNHGNMPMIEIGKTKLLNNQLGYVQLNEHINFRKNAHFEV